MKIDFSKSEQVRRVKMFTDSIRCDVVLKLEMDPLCAIPCHWFVLCEASDFFKTMYESDCLETQTRPGCITIGFDIKAEVLRSIVKFFYSRDISINDRNCFDVLAFCHMYLIERLLHIAKRYFLTELDLTKQTAEVLQTATMILERKYVVKIQVKLVAKLSRQHSLRWMGSPAFKTLETKRLLALISQPFLHCQDETHLFNAIITWWQYDPSTREEELTRVLEDAIDATELSTLRVLDLVKGLKLQPSHPLVQYGAKLPIQSISKLSRLRTGMDNVQCLVVHLRQGESADTSNQVLRFLMKEDKGTGLCYSKLPAIENANDVTEAAGATFVQKLVPSLHYEHVDDESDFKKLQADLLFTVNISKKVNEEISFQQDVLSVKFEEKDDEHILVFTIYELRYRSFQKVRTGELAIPTEARFPAEEHLFHVHKQLLFVTDCLQRTVHVYDLKVMEETGKVFITTDSSSIITAAQILNIVVFAGGSKNCVFDLDVIAAAAIAGNASTREQGLLPLAKFRQPLPVDGHTKLSAEVIGLDYYLVIAEVEHLFVFVCDLDRILDGNEVSWEKQAYIPPCSHQTLKSVDLRRQKVCRRSHNWTKLTPVVMFFP